MYPSKPSYSAAALVRLLLVGCFRVAEGEALEVGLLPGAFEGLAGYDAVDLYYRGSVTSSRNVGEVLVPVRMFWNASSTLLASRADVSMKERWFSPGFQLSAFRTRRCRGQREAGDILAKALASSVGTARRCLKSLLLPTSMMTMLLSAWSRNSFSQRVTFSYVWCLLMS